MIQGLKSLCERKVQAMIDFKEEMNKYKPVRTVDEVEDSIQDEILDLMDLLQYISGKPSNAGQV